MTSAHRILEFGCFALDPGKASLCRGDRPLPLRPKSFDVLLYLATNPGRIVSKAELIGAVWPGIFVTDNSLVQCISDIRAALEDDGQTILKTVARRGYLFAAPVAVIEPTPTLSAPETRNTPAPAAGDEAPRTAAGMSAQPLRRYAALVAAGAAVVAVIWVGAHWWGASSPVVEVAVPPRDAAVADVARDANGTSTRATIAVLPFVTLGPAPTEDYFADGLTEDIIAALGRFAELTVLSPKAVQPYKGKTQAIQDIGRELKARYIAEGSIRRSPERIRIVVRLSDTTLGTLLWADQRA